MKTGNRRTRLIVNFQNETIQVVSPESVRVAKIRKKKDLWAVTDWPTFLAVVVAASNRPKDQESGKNDWWELEIEPNDFSDSFADQIAPFSLVRLEEPPFCVNDPTNFIYWELNHHGLRDSEGHSPGCGDPQVFGQADLIWLGGIISGENFNLYEQSSETLESAKREGFTALGRWVGRFITHPDKGEYKVQFFAPSTYRRPGLEEVEWES